ncbi:hypothetical protein [Streptococcus equi]
MFDPNQIKADFKLLDQYVNDEALVYLDNAATTQKATGSVRGHAGLLSKG